MNWFGTLPEVWLMALKYVVYVLNRLSHENLDYRTPYKQPLDRDQIYLQFSDSTSGNLYTMFWMRMRLPTSPLNHP